MQFASDHTGPVHPKVMEALAAANAGYAPSYGGDDWTAAAVAAVRNVFEAPEAEVFFVATGTAANALLLATLAAPYQTVFCTPQAHIQTDECNAPEFFTGGAKLTPVEGRAARMDPEALARTLATFPAGDVHISQPGAVSLTQLTERGTLYELDEIRALSSIAKAHGLPLHMDGARLSNALAVLGCSPAEMTWRCGVDALSLGGTKNGLMGAEAAVIFDPALARTFALRRKRGGHLLSKHRFLAAQFHAYLQDGLWLEMAAAANETGQKLARGLAETPYVVLPERPAANVVFAELPRAVHEGLQAAGVRYGPSPRALELDRSEARFVADWSATAEDAVKVVSLVGTGA